MDSPSLMYKYGRDTTGTTAVVSDCMRFLIRAKANENDPGKECAYEAFSSILSVGTVELGFYLGTCFNLTLPDCHALRLTNAWVSVVLDSS